MARCLCSFCPTPHPCAHGGVRGPKFCPAPSPSCAQNRCMPNSSGPSAGARQTALLKRQRQAGTVLDGAAAIAASAKKARIRGSTPPSDVGNQRQPYYHAVQVPPLPPALPEPFQVRNAGAGIEAAAMVREYASTRMTALLDADWSQELDAACRSPVTHAVLVTELSTAAPVGLVAAHIGARSVTVRVIHVVPRLRGHARLGEHLWRALLPLLQEATSNKSARHKLCLLSTTCARGAQAAAFWMLRCGWQGSDDATEAARRWHTQRDVASSSKTKVGEYSMSYQL